MAPEFEGWRSMPLVADEGDPIALVSFNGALQDWCKTDGAYKGRFAQCGSLEDCLSMCGQTAECQSFAYSPVVHECDFKRRRVSPTDVVRKPLSQHGYMTFYKYYPPSVETTTTSEPTVAITPAPEKTGLTIPILTAAVVVVVLAGALVMAFWYAGNRRGKAPRQPDVEGGGVADPERLEPAVVAAPLPGADAPGRPDRRSVAGIATDPKPVGPGASVATSPDVNVHHIVPPDRWCVTPQQLRHFVEQVESAYPDEDPSAYKVVDELIKPKTQALGCSWALMANPEGVEVTHFVTHAWAEGVKAFCGGVLERIDDGGIWICFLANPQTWTSDDLGQLLGMNPFQSPFFIALSRASEVLVVRNERVNLYTRLWCVFELWAANIEGKPVVTTGSNPQSIELTTVGYNAVCSSERDTNMLRRAMRSRGSPEDINMWIGRVLFHS